MSLGPGELVVILLLVLLLFGSQRVAALGKGIGEGIREFKRGISGESETPKTSKPASAESGASSSAGTQSTQGSDGAAQAVTSESQSTARQAPTQQVGKPDE